MLPGRSLEMPNEVISGTGPGNPIRSSAIDD